MPKKPIWIRDDVALAIHRRQISEHGGLDGIRDAGLLESALLKPQNLYHYSKTKLALAVLAASYAYGLVKNHPFLDGNKRTSFTIFRLFLRLNGKDFEASQDEKFNTFMKLASGRLSEKKFGEWLSSKMCSHDN